MDLHVNICVSKLLWGFGVGKGLIILAVYADFASGTLIFPKLNPYCIILWQYIQFSQTRISSTYTN